MHIARARERESMQGLRERAGREHAGGELQSKNGRGRGKARERGRTGEREAERRERAGGRMETLYHPRD